jgi:hypothetical protein
MSHGYLGSSLDGHIEEDYYLAVEEFAFILISIEQSTSDVIQDPYFIV